MARACGLIATGLLWIHINNLQAEAQSARAGALNAYGGEQVEVFVATRDIAAGENLDGTNTALQRWVSDLLPAGALSDAEQINGATLAMPLLKGEPILQAKLGRNIDPVSVPDGLCAMTVAVDDVQAVGGAIGQGSAVNVYASSSAGVVLVACDVLVLETSNGSLGKDTAADGKASLPLMSSGKTRAALKWVTLAVPPQMVQELLLAAHDKSLTLVLPGADAISLQNTSDSNMNTNSHETTPDTGLETVLP
jgi:pilus assembly protein CpaB